MRSHLASCSVAPKILGVLVWTQLFSYRFHDDKTYAFWIHFRARFHIDAVSPKRLNVRLSVDKRPKRIEMYAPGVCGFKRKCTDYYCGQGLNRMGRDTSGCSYILSELV